MHDIFQSTHPTRGCDSVCTIARMDNTFQSTHPTRGCDCIPGKLEELKKISIHAPHEGVRPCHSKHICKMSNFNPRTPRGGATKGSICCYDSRTNFNPRTPRGGATAICCSLISRVTTCCRPNITPLLDVVRFLNYCTNLLLFLGEPPRLFRTASGSPMSLHY